MARRDLDRRADLAPGRFGATISSTLARRGGGPVRERLAVALEYRLARAVERRLGGGRPGGRVPGALEARLVAALERRLAGGRAPVAVPGGAFARLARRRAGLPAVRGPTLGALVISLFARGFVRALVRLARLVGRGLVTSPARRLLRMLARRTARAGTSSQLGLLALLLALLAYVRRVLAGRAQVPWGAAMAAVRLAGRLLWLLRRPAGGLMRALLRRVGSVE